MAGEVQYEDAVDMPTVGSTGSPIRILPPELLAQIFEHYASVGATCSPVLLSHVSSFWRRTAITTPSLWHSISFSIPTATPQITAARVRAWLNRSGLYPLHISLLLTEWIDDDDFYTPLLNYLRTHIPHWSRLSLTAASITIARHAFLFFTSFPHYDMLSRLDIRAGSSFPFDPDDEIQIMPLDEAEDERGGITAVFAALTNTYAPRFTELNLAASALPYASWHSKNRLEFPHLRRLRIFERGGQSGEITALSVLHLLAKCPILEEFIFRGSDSFFEPQGVFSNVLDLSRLRVLHLAQTCHQRAILAHLFTPALEVLRLSWLNRTEVLIDESYIPDPTEASEEPTEWSQSSYTDILTGAGIRSLISRSTPPIRILDMDFADARSPKDFIWMFERLPTLESFRIVGSDMSNKVLDALAFTTKRGEWLCPRLTSLDFLRCDVITGRGVVTLAKSRNPLKEVMDGETTDDVAADLLVRPARLEKIVIEACAGVDCESVAVIQHIMDDIDFEVGIVSP